MTVDPADEDHLVEVVDFLPHDLLSDAFIVVFVGAGILDEGQGRK